MALDHEGNGDTGLDAEDIVLCARQFRIGTHIAAKVHHIDVGKLFRHAFAEAVERPAVDERPVGDEGQHAIIVQPVARPAIEPGIHVVDFRFLRR